MLLNPRNDAKLVHSGLAEFQAYSGIVLTEDKDFGELMFRMRKKSRGVILLRLPAAPWREHWRRLHSILVKYEHRFEDSFVVIEREKVRFRPLTPYWPA